MDETHSALPDDSTEHRVLTALKDRLRHALDVARQVHDRIQQGDPADAEIGLLESMTAAILRQAESLRRPLPGHVQEPLLLLLQAVQESQRAGAAWIQTQIAPELEATVRQQRVRDLYHGRVGPE